MGHTIKTLLKKRNIYHALSLEGEKNNKQITYIHTYKKKKERAMSTTRPSSSKDRKIEVTSDHEKDGRNNDDDGEMVIEEEEGDILNELKYEPTLPFTTTDGIPAWKKGDRWMLNVDENDTRKVVARCLRD